MIGAVDQFARSSTAIRGEGLLCPACANSMGRIFYKIKNVPAHSVRLVRSFDDAVTCRRGDISLAHCQSCGFIWNTAFDPSLLEYIYTDEYEATQTVSETFNKFHRTLAHKLVNRYDLKGKEVIEIGCGNGEFLQLLRELGVKGATGFDPACREARDDHLGITLVKDWYSDRYRDIPADFIMSKMVMEHVPDPGRFLKMIRSSIGKRRTMTFAMMPDMVRIMKIRAFWDIYYEHCSYFTLAALVRAFRASGFNVTDFWTDFDAQYTAVAASPEASSDYTPPESDNDLRIAQFEQDVQRVCDRWSSWIEERRARQERIVLWGGGSKGVAFLTTVGIDPAQIEFVVDVNEKKNGTFISGTGQLIVTPEFLQQYRPDHVVVMSPVYLSEISNRLSAMGLRPTLRSVEAPWADETSAVVQGFRTA